MVRAFPKRLGLHLESPLSSFGASSGRAVSNMSLARVHGAISASGAARRRKGSSRRERAGTGPSVQRGGLGAVREKDRKR